MLRAASTKATTTVTNTSASQRPYRAVSLDAIVANDPARGRVATDQPGNAASATLVAPTSCGSASNAEVSERPPRSMSATPISDHGPPSLTISARSVATLASSGRYHDTGLDAAGALSGKRDDDRTRRRIFRTAARQRDARRADGLVNLIELLITACESLRGVAATRRADAQRLLCEAAIITKNVRVHDEPALGHELGKPQRGFTGLLAAGEPLALQSLACANHRPFQLRAIETVCERRELFVEASRLRDAARLQRRTRLAVQGFEPLVWRGSIEGRPSVQELAALCGRFSWCSSRSAAAQDATGV